jgi:glycosyltransferase involved in cell wall biosynthesis
MQTIPAISADPRPQKVLQSCLSHAWGGLEMVAYENALALAKNGFEGWTLCLENSPLEQHLKEAHLPVFTISPQRQFFDFLKVRHFIREHQIQTILVQLLKDLRLLSMALINDSHVKVVAVSHTFVNVSKKDLMHRWSYAKIEKLICLTDLHRQNLLTVLPLPEEKLEVIPNYIDCERFHPRHRSEELRASFGAGPGVPLIGVASRLDPQKGQDFALRALALLKKRNIPGRLVVVGENTRHEKNHLEDLKILCRELKLDNYVHFAGYRDDMEAVMASLDILVMPSHCETFGRVLIEAMASKTPVIATNAGGVPNIIEADVNGLLVSPQSAEELALAIERLIAVPGLRTRLSEAAYFKVKSQYSKEVVEERLLDLLKNGTSH